ncbi:hypothetical protein GS429_05410 [Natronorubrum sp. JWXQ-INN-674]|uniref:DUF7978 domain-containing protein n=1 Tax=Natronorubrum halalkaliphilum TaxID=2691917 RepID=A0A6B0VIY3_9EURY|nr:hypothetical protein [Natronorubrum halalkaliphilum]MXV61510.1 hypothetical protein [Natronorubrum halalkaliphilum]
MSSNRRFEYDKGPRPDAEQPGDENERDADEGEGDGNENNGGGPTDSNRRVAAVEPWLAGLVSGVSAFAVVFAAAYQLAATMTATGGFAGVEDGPSRWVLAGLASLASHGVPIELDGEPIEGGFGSPYTAGLASDVTALIPVAVLLVTGYLLVRYVSLETSRDGALALGSLVTSYVVLAVGLSMITSWSPNEEAGANGEAETIAAATDLSMVVSVTGTALVFVLVGAAVAALPRLLELAPVELVDRPN